MAPESARLLDLAEAVAEGRDVDWGEAETTVGSDDDRILVRQLRLLAGVAATHRTGDDDTDTSSRDPLIGSRWGALEIRALIGAGSFGSVYRARDVQLDRVVALKIIRGTLPNSQDILREGQLLARIRHPHVVTVYGADLVDGRVGLWMELIQGRTLEDVLRQDGPLGAREAALVGIDLCSALAAVHAQGLVHRDIKAPNVMREEGGRIVLMDFGAGRDRSAAPASGPMTGTPLYMAPEVLRGEASTRQSDLYSLGVLLFRMVTGRYPVEGRSIREVRDNHKSGTRLHLRDLRPDLPPRFVAAVNRAIAPDLSDRFSGPAEFESALSPTLAAVSNRGRVLVGLAMAAVVAVGGAATWPWGDAPGGSAGHVIDSVRRIGVKPLKNLTGDSSQDFFSAGLTEVLLTQLGTIKALSVTAMPEPQGGQDGPAPPGLYGWLEGSVQQGGGRVRVAARLVQADGGAVVWAKTYEASEAEAFALQGRIAADVALGLNVSVTETESLRLTRKYSANPQAQDHYLRGRFLLDTVNRENLRKARWEFEEAIRLDRNYAPAYASLAGTYLTLASVGAMTPDETRALAPAAAESAVALDPELADAVLARAEVRFRLGWDWLAAEPDYRKAVELNPSDTQARGRFSRFLAAAGRVDEALAEAREAMEIDPLSAEIHGIVGISLYYQRKYDEAILHFQERLTDRSPAHVGLGRSYAGAGRYSEAITTLTHAYELSGRDPSILAEVARTWAAAGDQAKARELLTQLIAERSAKADYVAPQDLAYVHIALGEIDRAFELLFEAVSERASRLLWLPVDPRVDRVRSDARFSQLISQIRPKQPTHDPKEKTDGKDEA